MNIPKRHAMLSNQPKHSALFNPLPWLLLLLCSQLQAYEPIVLGVPDFRPYTYQQKGHIIGSAIEPVSNALQATGVNFKIRLYGNYSLLLKALRKDDIQGFFLASQNLERDKYAVFSKPFTTNNWTWFVLKGSGTKVNNHDFKLNGTVATIAKTNTFRWLTRSGYQVVPSGINELPNLLINKKVDAVFAAQAVFETRIRSLAIHPKTFVKTIEIKKPFAIYISKSYLENNEGMMEVLNGNIVTR